MIFHETFTRCEKCNCAYFRKNKYVVINKHLLQFDICDEEKTLTEYICRDCGPLLKRLEKTRNEVG